MEVRRWGSRKGGGKKLGFEGGRRKQVGLKREWKKVSGARGRAEERRWGARKGGGKKVELEGGRGKEGEA